MNNLNQEKREILEVNKELEKNINTIKLINKILTKQRIENTREINTLKEELDHYHKHQRETIESSNNLLIKYNKITDEYEEMKYYYTKELTNLKSDLETLKKERNEAVNMLIRLKEFVKNV